MFGYALDCESAAIYKIPSKGEPSHPGQSLLLLPGPLLLDGLEPGLLRPVVFFLGFPHFSVPLIQKCGVMSLAIKALENPHTQKQLHTRIM